MMRTNVYNPPTEINNGVLVIYPLDANNYAIRDAPTRSIPKSLALDVLSCTYTFLFPSSAPASVEGNIYYDSTAHKLKVRGAAGFETVTSV